MSQSLPDSEALTHRVGAGRDSAVSDASRAAREAVGAALRSMESSEALFGRKAAVISAVWALVNECAEPGWDGAGADPVDRIPAFRAVEVIRALPDSMPMPEVGGEPDGSISLDWIASRNQVFSLSVGSSDRLAYAWVDGSNRGHGVDRFDGTAIPVRVLQGIRETLKLDAAPVRTS